MVAIEHLFSDKGVGSYERWRIARDDGRLCRVCMGFGVVAEILSPFDCIKCKTCAGRGYLTRRRQRLHRWFWRPLKRLIAFPVVAVALLLWMLLHIAMGDDAPDLPTAVYQWMER